MKRSIVIIATMLGACVCAGETAPEAEICGYGCERSAVCEQTDEPACTANCELELSDCTPAELDLVRACIDVHWDDECSDPAGGNACIHDVPCVNGGGVDL